MDPVILLLIIIAAVASLLFLVLKLKIHAFISLMLVSIITGYSAGMTPASILESIQEGMGGTLGFIAVVVGLGAIFGKILEYSGGAEALAMFMINRFGEEKAPWALSITGFIIAIPVFLDVAFIILVPILYALSRKTKKSLLFYGIPLLAGLAATHSFIPPTPGPVAVSEITGANLGWVIILGFAVGIPVVILAGPLFGKYISGRVKISSPAEMFATLPDNDKPKQEYPAFRLVILIIGAPLVLILCNTITDALVNTGYIPDNFLTAFIIFIGHPFSALLIATFLAMYFLGIKRGIKKKKLQEISNASLGPAGIIILVTGAGGVLKQILIDSGIGESLAVAVASGSINPVVLGWLIAAVVRITQGSATVAMITAAGIISPILPVFELSQPQEALVVIAIAAGATILSHVNDSGFWLVGKYLGMDEKQTLQTWTVMETIIAVSGLTFAWLLYLVF
ncbi:MAG: gluconate:H+ symporter [Dissulfuribacterales bacterium]